MLGCLLRLSVAMTLCFLRIIELTEGFVFLIFLQSSSWYRLSCLAVDVNVHTVLL